MPAIIEPCDQTPNDEPSLQNSDTAGEGTTTPIAKQLDPTQCEPLFNSVDEFKTSTARCFYGDLSVIGLVWIRALTTALVGANLSLFPTVEARPGQATVRAAAAHASTVHATTIRAATLPCGGPEPEKPPKMKYTDLPLYDSPHSTYKDNLEAKSECLKSRDKIIHMMLLPYVSSARKFAQKHYCSVKCKTINSYNEVKSDVEKAHKHCMEQLRDPNNVLYRSGIVVSTASLCCIASGKGHAKRIFWTSFGAATSGMICFPKETDGTIREICSYIGDGLVAGYNILFCPPRERIKLRPRGKCRKDLPDELEHKSKSVCKDADEKEK